MLNSTVPTLEMLWESSDPLCALEDRFGFTSADAAGTWAAAALHEHWGLRVEACTRIVISERNALAWIGTASEQLIAKWSAAPERFQRLEQVANLAQWLDGNGLPVSAPLETTGGRLHVEVDGVSLSLQRVIRGDLLDVGDPKQVRAAGATLAHLHRALAAYPHTGLIVGSVPPPPLACRVTDWLGSVGDHVPEAVVARLAELVADAPVDVLPTQLVHGDFRSANVLCAGPEIAAVIDFEEVRRDHCINEVARAAVLLGTRFHDWGPVSPDVHSTFLAGFESVRRLTPVEARWWDVLVLWHTVTLMPANVDQTGWGPSALRLMARPSAG